MLGDKSYDVADVCMSVVGETRQCYKINEHFLIESNLNPALHRWHTTSSLVTLFPSNFLFLHLLILCSFASHSLPSTTHPSTGLHYTTHNLQPLKRLQCFSIQCHFSNFEFESNTQKTMKKKPSLDWDRQEMNGVWGGNEMSEREKGTHTARKHEITDENVARYCLIYSSGKLLGEWEQINDAVE